VIRAGISGALAVMHRGLFGAAQELENAANVKRTKIPDRLEDSSISERTASPASPELAETARHVQQPAKPVSFATILQSLLPPDFVDTTGRPEPRDIMKKLKRIGTTTWIVFKQVLKVAKEAAVPCPPLQAALGALSAVVEQLDVSKTNMYQNILMIS
jgi:hypothetical protein